MLSRALRYHLIKFMIKHIDKNGFTLIELVMVIVIIAIVGVIAAQKVSVLINNIRIEETKKEMDQLAIAIVGNPDLENNGVRTSFGYVGDVGAMPANLAALVTNPGSYSTWKGPYIGNAFEQDATDASTDAWGTSYTYSSTGTSITSTGSGSNIIRRFTTSVNHILRNKVTGNVFDINGFPPGPRYKDSVIIDLTIPNGSGSTTIKKDTADIGGYFSFDSIPVGNHAMNIIYKPDNDTLKEFVSVTPNSALYGEYYLAVDFPYTRHLTYVPCTGVSYPTSTRDSIKFQIRNNYVDTIRIRSINAVYDTTAYYDGIYWHTKSTQYWYGGSGKRGTSGETKSGDKKIGPNATDTIWFKSFKTAKSGGSAVNMHYRTFTVTFSDGSTMTFDLDSLCLVLFP